MKNTFFWFWIDFVGFVSIGMEKIVEEKVRNFVSILLYNSGSVFISLYLFIEFLLDVSKSCLDHYLRETSRYHFSYSN